MGGGGGRHVYYASCGCAWLYIKCTILGGLESRERRYFWLPGAKDREKPRETASRAARCCTLPTHRSLLKIKAISLRVHTFPPRDDWTLQARDSHLAPSSFPFASSLTAVEQLSISSVMREVDLSKNLLDRRDDVRNSRWDHRHFFVRHALCTVVFVFPCFLAHRESSVLVQKKELVQWNIEKSHLKENVCVLLKNGSISLYRQIWNWAVM